MPRTITVGELRQMPDVVGQVFASSVQTFVVVAADATSFNFMVLHGVFADQGGQYIRNLVNHTLPNQDDVRVSLQDKEEFKEAYRERWEEIAQKYPAIG